ALERYPPRGGPCWASSCCPPRRVAPGSPRAAPARAAPRPPPRGRRAPAPARGAAPPPRGPPRPPPSARASPPPPRPRRHPPPASLAAAPPPAGQLDEDALEEVEFFASNSMFDEARNLLESELTRLPNHPLLLERLRELEEHAAAAQGGGSGTRAVPRSSTPS